MESQKGIKRKASFDSIDDESQYETNEQPSKKLCLISREKLKKKKINSDKWALKIKDASASES